MLIINFNRQRWNKPIASHKHKSLIGDSGTIFLSDRNYIEIPFSEIINGHSSSLRVGLKHI
jgi:hypothetical protein